MRNAPVTPAIDPTRELRRQHDATNQLIEGITGQIGAYRGPEDAYLLTLAVAQLLGLMRVHLAAEDGHLYPALFRSGHRQAEATARRFADEMGGIAGWVEEFGARWSSSAGMSACFPEFCDEAEALFAAIGVRTARENDELYPLADELGAPPTRSAG